MATLEKEIAVKAAKTTAANTTDFQARFRRYIVAGAEQALTQVHTLEMIIQDERRRQSVLQILEFALEAPEALHQALAILETLAPQVEQVGFWQEWVPYMEKGIDQSQRHREEEAEARLRLLLGVLLRQMGSYDESYVHLTQSAQQFQQLGDVGNQAKALNRLAFLCRLQRNYEEANEHANNALELLDVDDTERAYSYLAHGAIAYDHEQYQEAVHNFQRAVNIIERTNDKRLIARHLRNLGPALRELGRYDEAIACDQRAIDLFDEVHDPIQKAQVHMNLGLVYIESGQLAASLEEFKVAEPILRRTYDRLYLALLSLNQGVVHRELKMWIESVGYLKSSIEHWKMLDMPASLANAYDTLGMTYLKQKKKEQALSQFQQALNSLTQSVDDPSCDSFMNEIKEHIHEANSLSS
ncbi:MAG: tetratricopeptide repeat protein [Chloroflexota bacterium]